ncbi:hypothetical protein FEZ60_08235 [Rhodococcus sp. MS16]|nr:hypothetical protein [Rhodococcus sp. MS16]
MHPRYRRTHWAQYGTPAFSSLTSELESEPSMAKSTRTLASLSILAAAALLATACGSSSSADDGPGSNPASGDPIKVGYINQEQAPSGSFPDLRIAAEAAVKYVNRDGGGVNGRPIELHTCITNGSPEASQGCANELVRAGVVVAMTGLDFSGPAAYEVLNAAGIPYVASNPIQGTDYNGENVFAFVGSSAGQYAAQAAFLARDGVKSVSVVVNDTPSGQQGANLFKAALTKNGITDVTVVPESPTATDFTSVVTAATRNNPDALSVLFVAPTCGQIMQAARSLGYEGKLAFSSGCLDPNVLASAGNAAEGAYFAQELLTPAVHGDDPQVQLYLDALDRYAGISSDQAGGRSPVGFSSVMTLAAFLAKAGDNPTTATVSSALRSADGVEGFMDSPVVCDGTALAGFSTICNATVRMVTVDNGKQVEASDGWIVP